METKQSLVHEERIINAKNGFLMLFVSTLLLAASIAMCILGPVLSGMDRISGGLCGFLIALGLVLFIVSIILYCGLKILNPNEALVFALFGKYYGTLKKPGYFWINPFCSPINPYDTSEQGDEKSLRGSSQEIADIMQLELQEKVADAGIQIIDIRITHLAYAPEIASAMLQRQQAAAIIDARQKIVEGAVGMVQMALDKLNENEIVELDEERKAAMVSNLLVVLCGNKDAQPIVNSGTIY